MIQKTFKFFTFFILVIFILGIIIKLFIYQSFAPYISGGIILDIKQSTTKKYINEIASKYQIDTKYSLTKPEFRSYKLTNNHYIDSISPYFNGNISDDQAKIWNQNYMKEIYCENIKSYRKVGFNGYQNFCYVYNNELNYPVYKYMPNSKIPNSKLKFNDFGWTGNDISEEKLKQTFRIAFLGGSTTQQMGGCDFSYPDYVEAYFDKWAELNNINIDFEVINTGKVAQQSMDLVAITETELLKVSPDLVVYYEGRNQFELSKEVGFNQYGSLNKNFLYNVFGQSLTFQKILNFFNINYLKYIENSKPNQNFKKISFKNDVLPVNLNQIINDFSKINESLKTINSELVISSFTMICNDSSIYNSINAKSIYQYWAHDFGKIKLENISRYYKFQNKVYKDYSLEKNINYIDVASDLEKTTDIFYDGIHISCNGVNIHAWSVFCQLLPLIKEKIEIEDYARTPDFNSKNSLDKIEIISFKDQDRFSIKRILCNQ